MSSNDATTEAGEAIDAEYATTHDLFEKARRWDEAKRAVLACDLPPIREVLIYPNGELRHDAVPILLEQVTNLADGCRDIKEQLDQAVAWNRAGAKAITTWDHYFAAAMSGLIAHPCPDYSRAHKSHEDKAAHAANYADAMLAERAKRMAGEPKDPQPSRAGAKPTDGNRRAIDQDTSQRKEVPLRE